MTPGEVAWRTRDVSRDVVDRLRFRHGWYPPLTTVPASATEGPAPFRVTDVEVGAWRAQIEAPLDRWKPRLLDDGDRLLGHRFTFFNLRARSAGDPIDWNRDLESGQASPRGFAPAIDYRNASLAGDAKVVWELNRHQHLVTLARAYRATGEERYAREVIAQMESWLDQSPFGHGMNWRSPLELGIRAINWVWAIDLIRESAAWSHAPRQRLLHAIHLHVWEVARKYSRGSSANNHLIGEAAGVFVATAYLPGMPHHREWHEESRAILLREIFAQTHPDGGSREQATGYQVFVLQFYLITAMIGRRLGRDFPCEVWARMEKMLEFMAALIEGGTLPMIGDADDGYVLDLGVRGSDPGSVLSAGAVLFDRDDFARVAGDRHEWAYWLLGRIRPAASTNSPITLASRAFASTGYYLLQAGAAESSDAVSVVFDCAELGFGSLAAHGHADALSIVLRLGGVDVLVDPGTYDYFTYPEWRRYLRTTAAHNTLQVDGEDQSVISGPFMWAARAHASLLEWKPAGNGGSVAGEHDGYQRLRDPVVHRRGVELDATSRTIAIRDEIDAAAGHSIALWFHFGEECRVTARDHQLDVQVRRQRVTFEFDPRLQIAVVPASDAPEGGWVSRGYHLRVPAPVVVARASTAGPAAFETRIRY